MSASIAVMMTVAAAAVVVQPRGCALTPPPVHLQAAAGIPEAGGGRAEGQGAQPGFLSGTLQPDSGTAGGGARSKLLAPEKPSDRASSPPFPVAPGGGHRSRTLLAARPRPPQGEGGGRASWVFPGSPLPRTSGPEHLPRAFVARPQAGLAPICRRPRPPPHLHAPPPRGGSRRPRPRPRPPGLVPTGRAREAGLPICPARRVQQPGVPKGRGAVPRNAFQAGARPEQSPGCGASPARLGPQSPPRAARPKGGRRSSPPPALTARPICQPARRPPPPPLPPAPDRPGAPARPSASSPQTRNCGAPLPGDARVSHCSSNLFCVCYRHHVPSTQSWRLWALRCICSPFIFFTK